MAGERLPVCAGAGTSETNLSATWSELPLTDERWASFVSGEQQAQPFHHPAWALLLAECYRYRAFALVTTGPEGQITAGLPFVEVRGPLGRRRWVCLPFTDHCAPLGHADPGAVEELERLRGARDVSTIEIRASSRDGGTAADFGFLHTLALEPDPDALFARFKKTRVQQMIQRAERDGVMVARGERRSDLCETFYGLHVESRRRLGLPVQPRRFFELFWERLVEQELAFVLLASTGSTVSAGAVFFAWKGTIVYKYAAIDRAAQKGVAHLVLWRAIQWACENGFQALDFGRTDAGNRGLREFKRGWGTTETNLVYTCLGQPASAADGAARRVLEPVIRRSPSWVCRALGEALYKYSA